MPIYREKKRMQDEKKEELQKPELKPAGNLLDLEDSANVQQVWKLIHKAASDAPAHVPRHLIPLLEVQQSRCVNAYQSSRGRSKDKKERRQSMALKYLPITPDTN